ncbi:MAG TPA: crotonase [Coxiellaceae bacterium]|nr:crotonase [Coxiellaceae bacterium]
MSEQQHWQYTIDDEGITWLSLDRYGEAINTISQDVLKELESLLDNSDILTSKGLVITSAKKKGFIAGADIKQFSQCQGEEDFFEWIRYGQQVFDKLEALKIPTVALINGFCLGGGYELALACRYRIADDAASTKIGLPEIKLGIHPGWGGCIRLPRLIGAIPAMGIILPGSAVSAKRAKRMGMVDQAVPKRQLRNAARHYVLRTPKPQRPSRLHALSNHSLIRPTIKRLLIKQLTKKQVNRNHYPSPYAVVDNWARDGVDGEAMINEARSISKMVVTDTAKNLGRVFFLQTKMKEIAKGVSFKPKTVHVIGAGTMGGDIAAWCALQGFQVTLQDQELSRLEPAMKRAGRLFKKRLKQPYLIQAALDRLQPDIKGHGIAHADVIIEAIFENLAVKQSLFQELEVQAKPNALLASNTSSIPLERIAEGMKDPSRLLGIHFFNPVAKMPLVEIVQSDQTQPELTQQAAAFVAAIKRSPVVVSSRPGFLVNRVLIPYLMEAMTLLEEGVPAEHIDQAAVNFGMPMGPITLADTVGLDVCLSVGEILAQSIGGVVPNKLRQIVEDGYLGVKSGQGFYTYKQGKKVHNASSSSSESVKTPDLTDRLILSMVNEAVSCLHHEVIDDADLLDAGMIFGTGFAPFRGGPIHYAKSRGVIDVVAQLERLSHDYGERFKPKAGWEHLTPNSTPTKERESI